MFDLGDLVEATAAINVRALPLPDAERVDGLGRGGRARVLEEIDEWVRIDYGAGEGWVAKQYLTLSDGTYMIGDTARVTTPINVRRGPESDSARIGGLYTDQQVTVIEETDEWLRIEYMNGEGWVAKQYLEKI
jgi:N-acetylmuramoyl-L-alanine amidase